MLARYHGEAIVRSSLPTDGDELLEAHASVTFAHMFDDVANRPRNLLPTGAGTISALRALGEAVGADPSNANGVIPAAYTYFGQFIDHDVSKTEFSANIDLANGQDLIERLDFAPLLPEEMAAHVRNLRTPTLDLDSVYGGNAVINPDGSMKLGIVTDVPAGAPPGISTRDKHHDLPRRDRIENPQTPQQQQEDREALIGDPRNDENLIIAQLHVAMLRAHNVLLQREGTFERARRQLRRRYQWAVLHDFLRRVCDKDVHADVIQNGPSFWKLRSADGLLMPLEFSAAAYRFGHSMVRQVYEHNSTFNSNPGAIPANFNLLFTFTALSGSLSPAPGPGGFDTLPSNWIIEWPRFFSPSNDDADPGQNPARLIDAHIAPELSRLPDAMGTPIAGLMGKLASRNLLRGYLMGLPTGQALASKFGLRKLSNRVILEAVPAAARAGFEAAGLHKRTPLWFYILAEAGNPLGPKGNHLGKVGSRILMETFANLIRHSPDSVLQRRNRPTSLELKSGEFTLRGIIKLGQDKGMVPL